MPQVFYSDRYVCSEHSFDTTRKSKWIAQSLEQAPIPGINLVEPQSLVEDQVLQSHSADYVRAVQTGDPRALAESQGFTWDAQLWPMVVSSNGGVVAAALAALDDGVAGSLSSGLHHARSARGAGFCTFNGLVIAAKEALKAGADSVLVLDLDAHCGGGTASLIAEEPDIWQVDVSVDAFDRYAPTNRVRGELVTDASKYLVVIAHSLDSMSRLAPVFDLCIYNAGMDPHELCSIGGMPGIDSEILATRERMVFDWCRARGTPIAFVLAGGYAGGGLDVSGLVELHRLTLKEAARVS